MRDRHLEPEDPAFTWGPQERALVLLDFPIIHQLAAAIPRPERPAGRPGEYPDSVYLLYVALAAAFGSHRAAVGWLGAGANWRLVREAFAKNGVDLPRFGPRRGQCLYNARRLADHALDLAEAFTRCAVDQAIEQDLLVDNGSASVFPDRSHVVVADGTVPRSRISPSALARAAAAGRPFHVDASQQWEAGDEKHGGHQVFGTKFYLASVRADSTPNSRVILDVAPVPAGRGYGGEAATAVTRLRALRALAPGMHGVRYDGALRGVHLDPLLKIGLSVLSPLHPTIGPRALRVVTCKCGRQTALHTINGAIGTMDLLDDGTPHIVPLPILSTYSRRASTTRWFHNVRLPCGMCASGAHRQHEGRRQHRVQPGRTHPPAPAGHEVRRNLRLAIRYRIHELEPRHGPLPRTHDR